MPYDDFSARLSDAVENENLEELESLSKQFFDTGVPDRPFDPALRFRSASGEIAEEGDVALASANALARAIRRIRYRRKKNSGYSGPTIVSEGDSWYQYPFILDDVIDNLMEPFAVLSVGAAGDTLSNMLAEAEYKTAIAAENADVFLFSAGGNDVLGGGALATLLHQFQPGMEVQDIIRMDRFTETLARVERGYQTVITEAVSIDRRLSVLFHGYDKPVPRRGGRWLGAPMTERGIPASLQPEITGFLIDRFNEMLASLETRYPQNVRHVDCRGRVGNAPASWFDELHPRNAGFQRVADLFEAQIEAARSARPAVHAVELPWQPRSDEDLTPLERVLVEDEQEALIDFAAIVGGEDAPAPAGLTKVEAEIVEDYNELLREQSLPDQDRRVRARRHLLPDDDESAFERILGISNLFPINYLSRGATKARAVAKIQLFHRGEIPAGSGSGFLVGPGLMLTNNHVIESRDAARRARAVFDYQEDDLFQNAPTKTFRITDDVFFTSDRNELDFTFASVTPVNAQGDDLSEFGQFTLIEESGKAVKGEPVSIVQHPRGGQKSIALRDSKILGVKGDFIYYTTDTEPGSSGSPVLNDQWLPVALHHRSVPDPDRPGKWIANRGIRISRIVATLRDAAGAGDADARRILQLMGVEPSERTGAMRIPDRPLRRREVDFIPSLRRADVDTGLPVNDEANFAASRWDGVAGYDADFLDRSVALPLPPEATIREVGGRPDLPYLHFSVVMHAERKLPAVTACNVDGSRLQRLNRRGSWRFDPRIPSTAQVGNDAYRRNEYDRGHLVRRLAPMWGTADEARFAEADTFHYTVATPQHARLNQRVWLELEDYLLEHAEANRVRMSIFTGPVFRPDDPLYRDIVRVPADYWKVAIAESGSGFRAVGYLHTQKNLIPTVDEAFGSYKTHRVPIHIIAELSGVDLGPLFDVDVAAGGFESQTAVSVVGGREDTGF